MGLRRLCGQEMIVGAGDEYPENFVEVDLGDTALSSHFSWSFLCRAVDRGDIWFFHPLAGNTGVCIKCDA